MGPLNPAESAEPWSNTGRRRNLFQRAKVTSLPYSPIHVQEKLGGYIHPTGWGSTPRAVEGGGSHEVESVRPAAARGTQAARNEGGKAARGGATIPDVTHRSGSPKQGRTRSGKGGASHHGSMAGTIARAHDRATL